MFLAFLLLVSNTGLAFNVHYCGGKIASLVLGSALAPETKTKSCCELKRDSKKENCCKDKKVVVQKKSDDGVIKSFSMQMDAVFVLSGNQICPLGSRVVFKTNLPYSYSCDANAPPLFKLYSQYLFYDHI